MEPKDRWIAIAGAAGGIGQAVARTLSAAGARLLLIDVNRDGLEALRRELPGPALAATSDLAGIAACRTALSVLDAPLWGLAHLVGTRETHGFDEAGHAAFVNALNLHVVTAFDLVAAAVDRFDREVGGRVVLTGSMTFRRGAPLAPGYGAAKGAIAGLTYTLSRRLAPKILVNAVSPGVVRTPMTAAMIDQAGEALLECITLKRFGTPEEIAGVYGFLLGQHAGYITGQVINVDGGAVNG